MNVNSGGVGLGELVYTVTGVKLYCVEIPLLPSALLLTPGVYVCVCVRGYWFLSSPQNCHIKFNRLGGTQAQSDLFWPISRANLIGGL